MNNKNNNENIDKLCLAINNNALEFAVMYSGHGSGFRFDGENPNKPTLPLISILEAFEAADYWIGHADTIGGDAQIYHAPTNQILNKTIMYRLDKAGFQVKPETLIGILSR